MLTGCAAGCNRRRMAVKRTAGMFLFVALACAAESANGQRWTPAGLDSGNVWVIAASAEGTDPALYALTGSGFLFASFDDGSTWVRRRELAEIGLAGEGAGDLIVASDDSRT